MSNKTQASQRPIGEGRRLRWARSVIKKWGSSPWQPSDVEIINEINEWRYERAVALIVAQKLKQ